MADTVIRVEGLGKKFVLDHEVNRERYVALRDVLAKTTRNVGQALIDRLRGSLAQSQKEEFWALKDVSFEVNRGDVVGVIGRNGAGKSTLLRILSRITEPSAGKVTISGRVASLLEVGTGFHPELTGRENIYLNGAILGMSRAEVRRKFDEIVDFADVERFLDTPVKRYSSGMHMRLAFAVAAYLESDILVVDEVLAVGDAAFQKKCLGRMGDVSASGRTILFVSHNVGALMAICRTGILLEGGTLRCEGDIRSVAQSYQRLGETGGTTLTKQSFRGPLVDVSFDRIELNDVAISGLVFTSPGERLVFRLHGMCQKDVPNFRFFFSIFREGTRLFTASDEARLLPAGQFAASITIPARLLRPGDYMISLGGRRVDGNDWIWGTDLATVTVMEEWGAGYDREDIGMINLPDIIVREPAPLASAESAL